MHGWNGHLLCMTDIILHYIFLLPWFLCMNIATNYLVVQIEQSVSYVYVYVCVQSPDHNFGLK